MMHKKTLHSLLIVSFIAVFAAASFAADQVIVQDRSNLQRCATSSATVTGNLDADISALEVVLDVSTLTCGDLTGVTVTWNLDAAVLTDRVIQFDGTMIRFAAMSTGPSTEYLAAGTSVAIATIGFTTSDCDDGEAIIAGATWPSAPPFGPIVTQFVDALTSDIRPVTVDEGVIAWNNKAPVIVDVAGGPFTILHGDLFEYTLTASDPDDGNGCENLTFNLLQGPDGMEIVGDVLSWQTDGDDVCEFDGDILVQVEDKYGLTNDAEAFQICVTNTAPYITNAGGVPTDVLGWGDTFAYDFDATDDDPGPYGPFFHVINWTYAAPAPTIDPNTGELVWATGFGPEYSGVFTVEVEVNDGAAVCDCAPENATSITFEITVNAFALTISKEERVFLGQERVVTVSMLDEMYLMPVIGGFDFLIQYDNSAMSFLYAEEGDFLVGCEWEYFTYRYGASGNCGAGACPSGVLRVVAIAETTGGDLSHSPICDNNDAGTGEDLVYLHFLVSNDALLECQYAAIRWIWYDCSDNGVSTTAGDSLLTTASVWDYAGDHFNDITFMDGTFPTLTGAPLGPTCDTQWKRQPWRLVHYYNGGLDLICADDIDAVGDINLNSIAYEIADAVMFTNYFISGLSAFADCTGLVGTELTACQERQLGSIAASDTNKDGITLSVADLVYLIRVIVGDALPYAKQGAMDATYTVDRGVVAIDAQVGGVAMVVDGEVMPNLLVPGMTIESKFDGDVTRIVVTPDVNANVMNSFNGNFVAGIDRQIISIDAATPDGQPIALKNVPTDYGLSQNYPNPFNPTTKIGIDMKAGGKYSLAIYNIQGQIVDVIDGQTEGAQHIDIEWDASNLASGVYFYKLTAGDYTAVKKAVLLK